MIKRWSERESEVGRGKVKVREGNWQVHRQYCHSCYWGKPFAAIDFTFFTFAVALATEAGSRFPSPLLLRPSTFHCLHVQSLSLSEDHICTFSRLSNSASTTTTTFSLYRAGTHVYVHLYACTHTQKQSDVIRCLFFFFYFYIFFFLSVCR